MQVSRKWVQINPSHLNLSAGYLHAHTADELLLIPAIDFAINNGIVLLQMIDKPFKIDKPKPYVYPKKQSTVFTYSSHTQEDGPVPDTPYLTPTCDICGKHRPVVWIEHADAVVCRKCIRRAGGEDKITYHGITTLQGELREQQRNSRLNNMPFVPSCPKDKSHTDIYPMKNDVFFCDDCSTFFWQVKDGVYWWTSEDSTTATFDFYSGSSFDVSVEDAMCPLDNCRICNKLMPDKHLYYYTDQKTNEITLVVCDDCNAVDRPTKRGK